MEDSGTASRPRMRDDHHSDVTFEARGTITRDGFRSIGTRSTFLNPGHPAHRYLLHVAAEKRGTLIGTAGWSAPRAQGGDDDDYTGASPSFIRRARGRGARSALVVRFRPARSCGSRRFGAWRRADGRPGPADRPGLRSAGHDQLLSELATLCARYPLVEMSARAVHARAVLAAGRLSRRRQVSIGPGTTSSRNWASIPRPDSPVSTSDSGPPLVARPWCSCSRPDAGTGRDDRLKSFYPTKNSW